MRYGREERLEKIRNECLKEAGRSAEDLFEMLLGGTRKERISGNLFYHTVPALFENKTSRLITLIERRCAEDGEGTIDVLRFLLHFVIDSLAFPGRRLLDAEEGNGTAAESVLPKLRSRAMDLLETAAEQYPQIKSRLLDEIKEQTFYRLKAEGLEDKAAEDETRRMTGGGISGYVGELEKALTESNFFTAARELTAGNSETEIGNDYAVFLQYVLWLGGTLVTTNPVLIKLAWDIEGDYWDRQADAIIKEQIGGKQIKPQSAGGKDDLNDEIEQINSLITMMVVENNCLLLRDIFLATEGERGYVSLQVNPKNHFDADGMAGEVFSLYERLEERLQGVPNVVFKLPATSAGLSAAERITEAGIGVTITVNFSVFQTMEFAKVISRGNAPVSFIALMNGRAAYPIRDELTGKGIEGGVEAAKWAGVEITRKSYRLLYSPESEGGMGIDRGKVKLLIASLRDYDGWFPDISELWGCPVITVFPDIRRVFDGKRRSFTPSSVQEKTPADALSVLRDSEIFRQAWWMPGDSDEYKPERVLTLSETDREALLEWPPVRNTLGQFISLYEEMGEKVRERIMKYSEQMTGARDLS